MCTWSSGLNVLLSEHEGGFCREEATSASGTLGKYLKTIPWIDPVLVSEIG